MKFASARRRSIAALFLATTPLFSAGCSIPLSVKVATDCIWFADQRFSAETKAWLAERSPWPDHARADFERVARNSEKAAEFCK